MTATRPTVSDREISVKVRLMLTYCIPDSGLKYLRFIISSPVYRNIINYIYTQQLLKRAFYESDPQRGCKKCKAKFCNKKHKIIDTRVLRARY